MERSKIILSIFLYLIFLLILFEGLARLCFIIPPISNRLMYEEDSTWRRIWIARHMDQTEVFYSFDALDPTKGWKSEPNMRDLAVFDQKILNTNSRGLRGKKDFSYDRDPNKLRILILGDSFTFGDEVSDNETYSYYLQKMLPNAEIINMGVHGYGHDQMLIYLEEEGVKYKPDIVILGFLQMDMSRNLLNFRDYAKPKFVISNDGLKITGYPIPRPEDILKWNWLRPRLYDIWSILRHKARVNSGLYERQMNEITKRILWKMVETVSQAGAVPVLIYLPATDEIGNQTSFTEGERFLFSWCDEKDLTYCFSTRPYFADNVKKGAYFNMVGHWSPLEHFTVAQAIHDYLKAKDLLSLRNKSVTVTTAH